MTPTRLLSEAAQRMIDEHRDEQRMDDALEELAGSIPVAPVAQVFVSKAAKAAAAVRKPMYTAEAMVQLMIDHPEYSHAEFADHFGYRASWFAGVLCSDRFQKVLEPRRAEVSNPALTGTMQDMMQAVTVQALVVLQERLNNPQATEDLIIKALNAGVKALGMGTPGALPPPPAPPPTLGQLAERLSKPKVIESSGAPAAHDYTIEATLEEIPR